MKRFIIFFLLFIALLLLPLPRQRLKRDTNGLYFNSSFYDPDTGPKKDNSPQRILLIGDSMAYFLMRRLAEYAQFNKHDFKAVAWVSASVKWFAQTDTLDYFLNEYQPTFVLFVIGANELYISDYGKKHGAYIKSIESKLKGHKSLWIGPPNWKPDKGINDYLLADLGVDRFFLSKKLTFKHKAGDVSHPTRASAAQWVDSLVYWIENQSAFPVKLDKPLDKTETDIDYHKIMPMY
jgi:hypothetical protein